MSAPAETPRKRPAVTPQTPWEELPVNLSATEAALWMGVHPSTMRKWIRRGGLEARQGLWLKRIDKRVLLEWAERER